MMEKLSERLPTYEEFLGESNSEKEHESIISQLGYKSKGKLGKGSEGTVYDVGSDRVIKIANDKQFDEYAWYDIDIELQKNPNKDFNKVYDTGVIDGYRYSIKEKMSPFKGDKDLEKYVNTELDTESDSMGNGADPLWLLMNYGYFKKVPHNDVTKKYYDLLDSLMSILKKLGIEPDLSTNNIGVDNRGNLKIIDG